MTCTPAQPGAERAPVPPAPGAPHPAVGAPTATETHAAGRRRWRRLGTDAGMTTAEYATGTLAACGFAGVLLHLVHSAMVFDLLSRLLTRAMSMSF